MGQELGNILLWGKEKGHFHCKGFWVMGLQPDETPNTCFPPHHTLITYSLECSVDSLTEPRQVRVRGGQGCKCARLFLESPW